MLTITTDQFAIRRLRAEDAAAIAAYRSDPLTANLQSWTSPYPVDKAATLIDEVLAVGEPADGQWYTVGIADRQSDELLGDVAIHLEWEGRTAEIGYTLAPAARGRGLATLATGHVIDHLCSEGVLRFRAETHPDNVSSMRVLERLGFLYEGTDRQAYWVGDEVSDNVRYGMSAAERAEWTARSVSPPAKVELVELDAGNKMRFYSLATHHSQRHFVAPVAKSLADALLPPAMLGAPVVPWLRGVVADDEPAGFVMLSEVTEHHPDPYLWRLLIDRRHQRRSIGQRVVGQIADQMRTAGHLRLLVSYVPDLPGTPSPFYGLLGFVPTGEMDGDEVVAALDLATPPAESPKRL